MIVASRFILAYFRFWGQLNMGVIRSFHWNRTCAKIYIKLSLLIGYIIGTLLFKFIFPTIVTCSTLRIGPCFSYILIIREICCDYNPSHFLFVMLIRASVIKIPLGHQNLNNNGKSKGILVVVVKWRQRANLLFKPTEKNYRSSCLARSSHKEKASIF